jgi:hypothetical protein
MGYFEKHKHLVHFLARFGSAAIGVVYLLVGTIALLSLLGIADGGADEEQIMEMAKNVPAGDVMIWIIVAGMFGYIIWRVFEAITDPYEFGSHKKGLMKRTGIALSGFGYGIIAFSAIQVLTGNGEGEEGQELIVAQVLEWPLGPWIVGAAGAIAVGAGFVQLKFVYDGSYNQRLDVDHFSSKQMLVIHIMAWAGYIARGVILGVIGYLIIKAAITHDPEEVGDTDSAFDSIGDLGAVGHGIFALVAIGTITYGLFMFLFARYYKFRKGGEIEA